MSDPLSLKSKAAKWTIFWVIAFWLGSLYLISKCYHDGHTPWFIIVLATYFWAHIGFSWVQTVNASRLEIRGNKHILYFEDDADDWSSERSLVPVIDVEITDNPGGKIEPHNVGRSFTVRNTMTSNPSDQRFERSVPAQSPLTPDHARLFRSK